MNLLGATLCFLTFPLRCQHQSRDCSQENISVTSNPTSYVNQSCIEAVRTEDKVVSNSASVSIPFTSIHEEIIVNEIVDSINAVENIATLNRIHGIESVFYCVEGCFIINHTVGVHDNSVFDRQSAS